MYKSSFGITYGFHGMDKSTALKILNQQENFHLSANEFDWLGGGVYFWENNLERAKQYAVEDSKRRYTKIKEPFVLGAVLELGNCLDLLDQKYNDFLVEAYRQFVFDMTAEGKPLPVNKKFGNQDFDFKARELDCAVIRYACALAESNGERFDSVRAAFMEGEPLYEGAMFRKHNHIQIAVINLNCIKGVFLPRVLI